MGNNNNLMVTVKYKAQPLKSEIAISKLTNLIKEVSQEPHFVSIKIHVDLNDNSTILLYEEWNDSEYYNGHHMNTPHLQDFIKSSGEFLAGPPEITQWRLLSSP